MTQVEDQAGQAEERSQETRSFVRQVRAVTRRKYTPEGLCTKSRVSRRLLVQGPYFWFKCHFRGLIYLITPSLA